MDLLTSLLKLLGRAQAPDTGFVEPAGLLSPARAAAAPPARPAVRPAAGPVPARDVPGPFEGNVNRHFTAALLGVGTLRASEVGSAERRIVEQLEELAGDSRASNLVPRLPVVLPRLIALVRRDDVSPRDLAERLSSDPTLVGELVRLANSPRYRTGRDIADLQEAVIAIGQRGLMQLVISAAMRPIFNAQQGRFSRNASTRVWDLTERCSHACAHLCSNATGRFQAYLAGMAANIGLITALRVLDAGYWEQPSDAEDFHDALGRAAAKLSGRIARQWEFPPTVCRAIDQGAVCPPGTAGGELSEVLRTADRISKWHVLVPGLSATALEGLDDSERGCYIELERAFSR